MSQRLIIICLLSWFGLTASAQTLTLDSCLQLARTNNRDIRSAALNVDKAKQVKAQVVTKFFPSVSGGAMGYHSLHPQVEVGIDNFGNAAARDILTTLYGNYGAALGLPASVGFLQYGYMAGVAAVQPVFVGGKIVNGNRLAQVGVEAAELQQEITERDKLESIEQMYWLIVGLQDKQSTLTTTLQLLDTIHHTVSVAVEAGIALKSDLLQVEMRQAELERTQVQLTNGILLATEALCQSIGIPYSDSLHLESLVLNSPLGAQSLILNSPSDIQSSPESQLLALQTKANELQYKMTLADALPKVAVGAAYGYSKLQADVLRNDIGNNKGNGALMVTVSVPLTSWWETGHKLKEKKLAIEQAQLEQADKNELLNLRLQQAYHQLLEAQWMCESMDKALLQAEENYRLSLLNYQAGMATITDLLTAQALLSKAQNDCLDAQITYRLACRHYTLLAN